MIHFDDGRKVWQRWKSWPNSAKAISCFSLLLIGRILAWPDPSTTFTFINWMDEANGGMDGGKSCPCEEKEAILALENIV